MCQLESHATNLRATLVALVRPPTPKQIPHDFSTTSIGGDRACRHSLKLATNYSLPSAYLHPDVDPIRATTYPSPTITPTSSRFTPPDDYFPDTTPTSRKPHDRASDKKLAVRAKPTADQRKNHVMTKPNADKDGEGTQKAKRVRTGCLTCRERHLKCDEGLPNCNNCLKSNRVCKRGLKLNFIDTWAEEPPVVKTTYGTQSWKVEFLDESREIANEYEGGLQKYRPLEQEMEGIMISDPVPQFDYTANVSSAPNMAHQALQTTMPEVYPDPTQQPDMNSMFAAPFKPETNGHQQPPPRSHSVPNTNANYSVTSSHSSLAPGSVGSYEGHMDLVESPSERKEYLDNANETLFMQVFVEEVGLWMDSMDPHKHFSRLLPFHALSEPMLLNAFLACGARHLALVNPVYKDETALHYYDTATSFLLKSLQNPNRDTVICATTAVILNVYEIMSERALQRMNHIAGARALIKECGWNARTRGVGAACFWLNVGLEVMSCLHFNWQVAWNPDEWGVDMDFSRELENGREEIWTHRMLYIIGKVANFRATIPSNSDPHTHVEEARMQQRLDEWTKLKDMADRWNSGIPRTMHPMAYLYPYQTTSKSAFPEVWLVKRSTIVARLFYHTAQLLLAQIHPYIGPENEDLHKMRVMHSQQICGIAAHVKDRGVASVAIRSLAHAAEVLTLRHEQEEVLRIFAKINKETGWKVGYVYGELKEKWGWNEGPSADQFAQTHTAAIRQREAQELQQRYQQQQQRQQSISSMQRHSFDFDRARMPSISASATTTSPPPLPPPVAPLSASGSANGAAGAGAGAAAAAAMRKMPQGIPNPMYAKADFSLPQHPYQNFYVAPNHVSEAWSHGGPLYYSF